MKVGNLTTRLEKVIDDAAGKETLLLDTVKKIADQAKETFGVAVELSGLRAGGVRGDQLPGRQQVAGVGVGCPRC